MIIGYIWWVIAFSVFVDIVFCLTSITIEPDVAVVGGSTNIKCGTSLPVEKIFFSILKLRDTTSGIISWKRGSEKPLLKDESIKMLQPSSLKSLHANFTSVKCKDADEYTCSIWELDAPKTQDRKSQLIVIDNSPLVTLKATSQCTGNDCSKCAIAGFTGSVLSVDDEATFECSKEMAFHENVTNYFKWFIYGNGGWVEKKKTTPQSTNNFIVKKGTCLRNEYSNDTMSYTPKMTDPVRMKVKCVAEMHIYGKLKDSKEMLLELCVLGGATPTADPLANRGNENAIVGGVVGVAAFVAIRVGVGFY